jgi:transposase-like protein
MSRIAAVPPDTTRWVASRKAAVVETVRGGEISLEEACRRYQLSEEEFFAWERAFKTHGLLGLRASCVQQPYRLHLQSHSRAR